MTFLVLTSLVLLMPTGSIMFTCPTFCKCNDDFDHISHSCFESPGGSLIWSARDNSIEVNCEGNSVPFDYTSMPYMPLAVNGSLREVILHHCNLPGTFSSMLARVGAASADVLKLYNINEELRPDHVQGLQALTWLVLNNVNQTRFPFEVINVLPALETIIIRGGSFKLEAYGGESFPPHSALREVSLTENDITEIPASAFMRFNFVKKLKFSNNKIKNIHGDSFRGLVNLYYLSFTLNPLTSLPHHAFACTPQLSHLDLRNTHISEISTTALKGLQHLTSIKFVTGSGNVDFGSHALGALSSLEEVTFTGTYMKPLPQNLLKDSTELTNLEISNTNIEVLPRHFFMSQKKLKRLILSANNIKALDKDIFWPLKGLTDLNLIRNKIEEFPNELFFDLVNLTTLAVDENRLKHIAGDAFFNVPSLEVISLNDNFLTLEGKEFPFKKLKHWSRLNLHGNKISRLRPEWNNSGIIFLKLSRNNFTRLTSMEINIIITNGIDIDLRENNIATVNLTGVTWRKQLNRFNGGVLSLDDNPFRCDCDLYMFAKIVQVGENIVPEYKLHANLAKCASPPEFANKLIRNLPLPSFVCKLRPDDCSSDCICAACPATRTVEIECDAEPSTYPDPRNYDLDMTRLRLRSVKSLALPQHIHSLNLSGVGLTKPPSILSLKNIKELDLSHNNLTDVPTELLKENISTRLRLTGNPFNCDCSHLDDIYTLQKYATRLDDPKTVTCSSGEVIINMNAAKLCERQKANLLSGSFAAVCILLGVAVGISYRYNYEIKVLLFYRGWCQSLISEDDLDENALYDAFVSFSQEDARWVAEHLIPKLEDEPNNFKLCVHYRDWVVGEMIPAQIASSVEQSRRTIVVLTEHFLKSTWAPLEFRAANLRAQRERRTRVLIVVLGDIPDCEEMDAELRAYLSTNTYLKWGDPWFWEKLKYAMPHRRQGGR